MSRAWLGLATALALISPVAAAAQPAPGIYCLVTDVTAPTPQVVLQLLPAGGQPADNQTCFTVDKAGRLLRIPPPPPPPEGSEPDPETVYQELVDEAADSIFDLAPGVDVDSGASLAVVVKKGWGIGSRPSNWVRYVAFDAKGEGTTSTKGSDHAEASLGSEIFCCVNDKSLSGGGLVSIQGKWGEFSSGEGTAAETHRGNQLLGRLGLNARWSGNHVEATSAVTRNWVLDSSGDLPLPKEFEQDYWQWSLDFTAGPRKAGQLGYVELSGGGRLSWTDDWDPYGYLALVLRRELEGKTAWTVRLESGKDPAFDYDQKIVLGMLLDLIR